MLNSIEVDSFWSENPQNSDKPSPGLSSSIKVIEAEPCKNIVF